MIELPGNLKYSHTERISDHLYKTRIGSKPINYLRSDGEYTPIDPRILQFKEPGFYSVDKSSLALRITKNKPVIHLYDTSKPKNRISYSLQGARRSNFIMTNSHEGIYRNVYDNIDWQISNRMDGIKSTVILHDRNCPAITYDGEKLTATIKFNAKVQGDVNIFDDCCSRKKKTSGIGVSKFISFDAHNRNLLTISTVENGTLIATIDVSNAIFPVYIDPRTFIRSDANQDGSIRATDPDGKPSYADQTTAQIARTLDCKPDPCDVLTDDRMYLHFSLAVFRRPPHVFEEVVQMDLTYNVTTASSQDGDIGTIVCKECNAGDFSDASVWNSFVSGFGEWGMTSTGVKNVTLTPGGVNGAHTHFDVDATNYSFNVTEEELFAIGGALTSESTSDQLAIFDETSGNEPGLTVFWNRRRVGITR